MAINSTTNLGLALPDQGEWAGTWGTNTNQQITELIDSAVAGTTTLSANADVTLTDTDLAANQSRQAIIRWTALNGATPRYINAPARSKVYVVLNDGNGTILFRSVGPTSEVTIVAGERCIVAWNGAAFFKVSSSENVSSISFGSTGLTPSTATSGAVSVAGTLSVANGGTGLTTLTTGYIPFGAGVSAFGSSSSLVWDSANGRFGVGTATPTSRVSLVGDSVGSARLSVESTSSTNSIPPSVLLSRTSSALQSSQIIGIIGMTRLLSDGASSTPFQITVQGSNNVSAPAGNVFYNATTSHALQIGGSTKLFVSSGGLTGVNTALPTAQLDVNADIIRLRTAKTPANSSDTGNAGDICWDSDYVYVCVATNTWKRAALSTW